MRNKAMPRIPSPEILAAELDRLMTSGSEIEAWRQKASDALIESGAIGQICMQVKRWAEDQLAAGRPLQEVQMGVAGGSLITMFQLALLADLRRRMDEQ